jgi:hypothetical protein
MIPARKMVMCFTSHQSPPRWTNFSRGRSRYSPEHSPGEGISFNAVACILILESVKMMKYLGSPHYFFNRLKNDSAFRSYSLEKVFQGTLSHFHAIEEEAMKNNY